MRSQPLSKFVNKKLRLLFWATAVTIPVISFTGRRLQHWFDASIGKENTGWLIIILLLITAAAYIKKFIKNWKILWWRLSVICLLLLTIIQLVPVTEERIHFILFGALGYLGVTNFGLWKGVLFCITFSVGDELFQWLLPDRVGDIADVLFNITASGIGIILARTEMSEK